MKTWLPPYRVRLVKGVKTYEPGDVIYGPGMGLPIASARFVAEFERAKLKGIARWEPVAIEGYNNYWEKKLKRPAPAGTYKLAILPVPAVRAKWEEMHPLPIFKEKLIWVGCAVCGRQPRAHGGFKGVVIDEESWTGADFFELTNIGGFIVTEAFVKFVAAGEFRGVPLEPAAGFVPSYARRRPKFIPPGGATSSSPGRRR
jgi:hypothetical protein